VREPVGDLAVVLHSHMPYVEGFGTYPFGEEWLFDAFARSHLPVLDVARDLTMSVTPVLADQLEAPGVIDRMRTFLVEHRIAAAERDVASGGELAVPGGA
jgi:1,4-alpha-glucan branching enzyme